MTDTWSEVIMPQFTKECPKLRKLAAIRGKCRYTTPQIRTVLIYKIALRQEWISILFKQPAIVTNRTNKIVIFFIFVPFSLIHPVLP